MPTCCQLGYPCKPSHTTDRRFTRPGQEPLFLHLGSYRHLDQQDSLCVKPLTQYDRSAQALASCCTVRSFRSAKACLFIQVKQRLFLFHTANHFCPAVCLPPSELTLCIGDRLRSITTVQGDFVQYAKRQKGPFDSKPAWPSFLARASVTHRPWRYSAYILLFIPKILYCCLVITRPQLPAPGHPASPRAIAS